MALPDYSLSDIVAATGNGKNNNDGFGNNDGILWLLLFILIGGFGNNRGYGGGYGGAGGVGGNELYPWLNNAENVNGGFRDQMLQTNVQGIQQQVQNLATQLCNCCGDLQQALCNGFNGVNTNMLQGFNSVNLGMLNGFNGVEQSANTRQVANMQTQFGMQTAMAQGFNGLQAQLADCCCENRLATANQTATILAENCADRAALSDGVRDIIASQTAGTQRIIDWLCQDKIDQKNDEISRLRQEAYMKDLAASQAQQNAFITQGFANEVDALYNRLNSCPVPTTPVYGRTPIFTCNQNQYTGCGCGCNG